MTDAGDAFYSLILAYHHVTATEPAGAARRYALSARQFEAHIEYLLARGYRCLSLDELVLASARRPRAFALTFDDGYADFIEHAYPILERHALTATVFLVAERIGGQSDWEGEASAALLDWRQIRELQRAGITFGSHTRTHRRLTQLTAAELQDELQGSKGQLEAGLGAPVTALAYPFGDSDAVVQQAAAAAGYALACGSTTGRPGRFNIWRCPCGSSQVDFAFEISPWGRRWRRLRQWAREETAAGRLARRLKRRLTS